MDTVQKTSNRHEFQSEHNKIPLEMYSLTEHFVHKGENKPPFIVIVYINTYHKSWVLSQYTLIPPPTSHPHINSRSVIQKDTAVDEQKH